MKGIVFNLLEEVIRQEYGEEAWDSLLEAARLDGSYTALGSYPEAELQAIVAAATVALGQSADDILRWFGRKAIPFLAVKYPQFFSPHTSTRPFLLTLNHVIHPEVRKIYPGAVVPVFEFDTSADDTLVMQYRSERLLCSFAAGLIDGAAEHYGEQLALEHPKCMSRGDADCLFRVSVQRSELAA
jgi:hypothetical protein